jgi:hypothetical protein
MFLIKNRAFLAKTLFQISAVKWGPQAKIAVKPSSLQISSLSGSLKRKGKILFNSKCKHSILEV